MEGKPDAPGSGRDATRATPAEPDPDATVSGPLAAPEPDPDATVSQPISPPTASEPDPEDTVRGPSPFARRAEPDPEDTVRGPAFPRPAASAEPGADETMRGPLVDPDAERTFTGSLGGFTAVDAREALNPFAPQQTHEAVLAKLNALGGLNPLLAAANPVLGSVSHIRQMLRQSDPGHLREALRDMVETFDASADAAGIDPRTIHATRYALCALIDEAATHTPWGAAWREHGMVHEMFDAPADGGRLFAHLEEAEADPWANRDLLEFFYVCLALGYEGRLGESDAGKAELQVVRERLYAGIRRARPDRALSGDWRGLAAPKPAPPHPVVLWGMALGALVVLAAQHAFELPAQDRAPLARVPAIAAAEKKPAAAEPASPPATVSASVQPTPAPVEAKPVPEAKPAPEAKPVPETKPVPEPKPVPEAKPVAEPKPVPEAKPAAEPKPAPPSPPAPPPLATLLAEDLSRGLVSLATREGRTTIEMNVARQFAAGSDRVTPALRPLLLRVARALAVQPGRIAVVGHTDDLPMRARNAGGNEALSLRRAQSAMALIAPALGDASRLRAEGRAAREPVAPNDRAANRARNRRVSIGLEGGA